jgi:hypothetical protein
MQGAPAGAAAGALLAAACLALAACGLGVVGLSSAADGGPGGLADATTDVGSPTGNDATSGDEPPGANDASVGTPDAVGGGDGAVDASGAGDVEAAEDTSVVDAASEGAADVATEAPPPQCPPCGLGTCCSGAICVTIGATACGDPGQKCVDCTGAAAGNQCILLNLHEVCGCAGPANEDQCPTGDACHNQQCGTSCDGQHPCNGGCCSGNLATSTCVVACPANAQCTGNYCQ